MDIKITSVKTSLIQVPLKKVFHMSIFSFDSIDEIIVEIHTNAGIIGVGQVHDSYLERVVQIIENRLQPMIVGEDPLSTEYLWGKMFDSIHRKSSTSPSFRTQYEVMAGIAGIDIALWDIKAKAAGLPLHRLLGGYRKKVPVYASGGYYCEDGDEVSHIEHEVASYLEKGYTAVKIKVGRVDLELDEKRVRAVRRLAGDKVDLMLDANQAWDVSTAIAAARLFGQYNIRWLEEPVHWYDGSKGTAFVRQHTNIPIASGETEYTKHGCRNLLEDDALDIMQFDATMAGGVTEWKKVAAIAEAHNVAMAPHHDPQIHMHLIASVPNGLILEGFPDPVRDPIWEELYAERPKIKDGYIELPDVPGLGYEIDGGIVEKYRVQARRKL